MKDENNPLVCLWITFIKFSCRGMNFYIFLLDAVREAVKAGLPE